MHTRHGLLPLLLAAAACGQSPARPASPAVAPAAAAPASAQTDDLVERLAALGAQLEAAREEHHVPGMALAIVKDDRVVLARGFGVRDLDTKEPVTPETIFCIGSSTKAFTATLAAMLVDQGTMAWDDPITKYLPELTMKPRLGDTSGEPPAITIRDLLSHRTGFPRMDILWAAGTLSRAEILAYAARAEPTKALREAFQYNNVPYLAVGEASARAAGASWEKLLRARLLVPLGMTTTHVTSAEADRDPRRARGYRWLTDQARFEPENHRDLTSIAPAGSIYSNVREMSQWVRLQLGRGALEGKRLVSEAALAETHTQHIEVGGGIGYGLGWMVRRHAGQPFIEHGGNIDGYAAHVGFFPEAGLGYVLLTNVSVTALQGLVGPMIFDTLLGDTRDGGAGAEDFTPFLGEYTAEFAPFNGKVFKVVVKNGNLAVDVPGQMVFELKPPGSDGRRAFQIAGEIAVSFERDEKGRVLALRLYQAGFEFELPRADAPAPAPEVSAAEAAPYLGTYRSEDGQNKKMTVTVMLHRGRLAVDVPGQMIYQLHLPDEQGRRRLRVRREYYVVLAPESDGKPARLTLHQDGKEQVFLRVAGASPSATLDTVLALRKPEARRKAVAKLGLVVMEGTVRLPQSGVTGKVTLHAAPGKRHRMELDLGKVGRSLTVASGDAAWEVSSFDEPTQMQGKRLEETIAGHPFALLGDWRDYFDSIAFVGSEERDGKRVHIVELRGGTMHPTTIHVDAKTGDVVEARAMQSDGAVDVPVTMRFADHRAVRGVRVPHRIVVELFQSGEMILTIERVRAGVRDDGSLFPGTLPPAAGAAPASPAAGKI